MRAYLERALTSTWYGDTPPGVLLKIGATAYRGLAALARRRELASRASDLEGQPIIVVGNLTAGGTGKTPLVIYLCELLSAAGWRPGVVSRGYGRRSRQQVRVAPEHTARQVGDEPLLVFRRTGVPVIVGRDRIDAARACFAAGANVVISDDGLQRLRLPRALEICVVDGDRGFGNGRLLPAGPLREPARRLSAVDYVVFNGGPAEAVDRADAVVMLLQSRYAVSLDGEVTLSVAELADRARGGGVHAVAGIGHPDRFFGQLDRLGIATRRHAFPDHHDYNAADFSEMQGDMILMTEKDAVKCAGLGLTDAWYLPIESVLPEAWGAALAARIGESIATPGRPR